MAGSALVHARAGQARESELRVLGKGHGGGKVRTVDLHPDLRTLLQAWLQQGATWPGAASAALLLTVRGSSLSDRAARDIIVRLGAAVGVNDDPGEP